MKWRVEMDEAGRFVHAWEWDEFSLDDQAQFLSDIFTGPHWRPGLGVLIDYRGLKVTELTEADLSAIRVIFQSARKRLAESKLALMCDTDDLFELGTHFKELLASKLENRVVVFRDENAAIDWLSAPA
ncbi:MAG: hypothetical protein ABI646_00550 [Acidobacteriota bacterium]